MIVGEQPRGRAIPAIEPAGQGVLGRARPRKAGRAARAVSQMLLHSQVRFTIERGGELVLGQWWWRAAFHGRFPARPRTIADSPRGHPIADCRLYSNRTDSIKVFPSTNKCDPAKNITAEALYCAKLTTQYPGP